MMAQIVCPSVEFTQAAYSISRPTPFSKKIVTHCISQMHDDRRITPFRCRPKIWITRIRFHIENSVHVNFAYNKTFRPTSNSRFSNFSLYACVLAQYTQARCGVWRLCGLWHRWRHRRRRWPVPLRRSVPLAAAACGKQAQKKNGGKTFAASCLWPVACGGVHFVSPVACGGGGGIGGGLWPVPLRRSVLCGGLCGLWPVLRRFASAVACGGISPPFNIVPCAVFETAKVPILQGKRNAKGGGVPVCGIYAAACAFAAACEAFAVSAAFS